jgi:uncharacterized Zn-binding protein involved in type VI secretion
MPPVVRNTATDVSTGHPNPGPRPPQEGSPNVFVNTFPVVRTNDLWVDHHAPPLNDEFVPSGSLTVFVNSEQIVRQGDALNCGDFADKSSPDVFAGG